MTELIVFIVFGAVAVAFAASMLLSNNAVHSALSLIVTMVCIAVLFLALNAPFLAMIQITVYAGAIMVLFLFVIMLLGAEKLLPSMPGEGAGRFRWFIPLTLALALALLIASGLTIIQSNVTTVDTPGPDPIVRVVNLSLDAEPLTASANGITVGERVSARQASNYIEVLPGETEFVVTLADGTTQTISADLERGTAHTVLVYGDDTLAVIPDDLSTVVENRSGRFAVYNGYTEPVSLIDFGSELQADDSRTLIASIPAGATSTTIVLPERDGTVNWGIVADANPTAALVRLTETEVETDRSTLIVVSEEASLNGSLRPTALVLTTEARPSFGSPRAIGYRLFTDFMLPFQMLALLLLAAMVGVIVMTHRQSGKHIPTVADRRRVSRPLVSVIASQVGQDVTQAEAGERPALPEADVVSK